MLRATSITRKQAVKEERVVDSVLLDHDGRQRRRIVLTGEHGLEFLLDLEKATTLNDGDALKLEDGRLVRVKAAPQTLLCARAETPLRLLKTAWHLGNRHTPAELTLDALYIEEDHVLAEMLRGLGCSVETVVRPFNPENGAYAHVCDEHCTHEGHDHHGHAHHGHAHHAHDHHDHKHDHDHDHKHNHPHHDHAH